MNKQKATRKHVQGEDYIGRCPSNIYFEGFEGKEYGWTNEKMNAGPVVDTVHPVPLKHRLVLKADVTHARP